MNYYRARLRLIGVQFGGTWHDVQLPAGLHTVWLPAPAGRRGSAKLLSGGPQDVRHVAEHRHRGFRHQPAVPGGTDSRVSSPLLRRSGRRRRRVPGHDRHARSARQRQRPVAPGASRAGGRASRPESGLPRGAPPTSGCGMRSGSSAAACCSPTLAFVTRPGNIIADTKIDMALDPVGLPATGRCSCGTRRSSGSCRTRPPATSSRWARSSSLGKLHRASGLGSPAALADRGVAGGFPRHCPADARARDRHARPPGSRPDSDTRYRRAR